MRRAGARSLVSPIFLWRVDNANSQIGHALFRSRLFDVFRWCVGDTPRLRPAIFNLCPYLCLSVESFKADGVGAAINGVIGGQGPHAGRSRSRGIRTIVMGGGTIHPNAKFSYYNGSFLDIGPAGERETTYLS